MRRVFLLAVSLTLASWLAGTAVASAPGVQHSLVTHTWQGTTFVGGLDSCPILGATSSSLYALRDVELTDHINSTFTAVEEPLFQIDSVGSVHGVINTSEGTYTVAGGGLKEHRLGELAPWYFSGTGHVVISGPGGTVVGDATFQDLSEFPPTEFDVLFTSITACHLT
jgi:hypothetical protein